MRGRWTTWTSGPLPHVYNTGSFQWLLIWKTTGSFFFSNSPLHPAVTRQKMRNWGCEHLWGKYFSIPAATAWLPDWLLWYKHLEMKLPVCLLTCFPRMRHQKKRRAKVNWRYCLKCAFSSIHCCLRQHSGSQWKHKQIRGRGSAEVFDNDFSTLPQWKADKACLLVA